jgi:hypothetical protein
MTARTSCLGAGGEAEARKLKSLRRCFSAQHSARRLGRDTQGSDEADGVRAGVVGFRRIDSVARTAAELIREASSSGDHQALGRFLRSFTGYL